MCLNAPGISGEARFIVLRLFKHIQEAFRKRLFDGYSVDPGTVLRFDGTTPSDNKTSQLSVTFVCFPYLSLALRSRMSQSTKHEYPTRSLLQILYPYESTGNREVAPGFCTDFPKLTEHVLYVPQYWAVMIGSRKADLYVRRLSLTCYRICHYMRRVRRHPTAWSLGLGHPG